MKRQGGKSAKYKRFAIIDDRDGRRLVCHWMDRRYKWLFPLALAGLNLIVWWYFKPDLTSVNYSSMAICAGNLLFIFISLRFALNQTVFEAKAGDLLIRRGPFPFSRRFNIPWSQLSGIELKKSLGCESKHGKTKYNYRVVAERRNGRNIWLLKCPTSGFMTALRMLNLVRTFIRESGRSEI